MYTKQGIIRTIGVLLLAGPLLLLHTGPAAAQTIVDAYLVRTTDTSLWAPPSPDPSGITYWAKRGRFLISDGEVDEMPQYYIGDNVFEATTSGELIATYSTEDYSFEPTGIEDIEFNGDTNRFFMSDDNKRQIYEVELRPGGRKFTLLSSFSTAAFGDNDPEGLAYGVVDGRGKLFITDGTGAEIFVVDPGTNGTFDGVAPAGDDQVSHFDTAISGSADPEGVDFNPADGLLYLASNKRGSDVVVVTPNGTLVRTIRTSFLDARASADLTFAPSSSTEDDPAIQNLYIVDRGVDNDTDPDENDGKMYELSLLPPPLPPQPAKTLTFLPSGDTRVMSTNPASTYGTTSYLRVVRSGSTIANSYAKFAVSGVDGPVQSARVRLYVNEASKAGGEIYAVSNTYLNSTTPWVETGLTWNNAPPIGGTLLSKLGPVALDTWAEFDVTAAIQGDGIYSFGIRSTVSDSAYYNSREAATGKPELVIDIAAPLTATPTTAPAP